MKNYDGNGNAKINDGSNECDCHWSERKWVATVYA
jgi:hypothetical protein